MGRNPPGLMKIVSVMDILKQRRARCYLKRTKTQSVLLAVLRIAWKTLAKTIIRGIPGIDPIAVSGNFGVRETWSSGDRRDWRAYWRLSQNRLCPLLIQRLGPCCGLPLAILLPHRKLKRSYKVIFRVVWTAHRYCCPAGAVSCAQALISGWTNIASIRA